MKHNNRKENLDPVVFKTAEQLLEEQENSAGFSNKPAKDGASEEYAYDEHYTVSD